MDGFTIKVYVSVTNNGAHTSTGSGEIMLTNGTAAHTITSGAVIRYRSVILN